MSETQSSLFEGFNSLEELGELGLIEKIAGMFGRHRTSSTAGIGDDCAVLPFGNSESMLVTTDLLIENTHFYLDRISPRDLGYKALAVNLSDISAMGGKPVYAFLSIGLPLDIPLDWLDAFLSETRKLSEQYHVKLMGGDTTKSESGLLINYTVLGIAKHDQILWRSNAKPGDKIALLGSTGESGAGLKLLEINDLPDDEKYRQLIKVHNRPRIFIREAQFLARSPAVHAMIDLSDGILSDAGHIAEESGATLQIDVEELPLSKNLRETCEKFEWQPLELALSAGEDYSLLFTIDKTEIEKVRNEFREKFSVPFSVIGDVTDGPSELRLNSDGNSFKINKRGYDPFKNIES
ncbi:MAG: thiamine-phosphate kinase [Balneolaceae bacterium]